MVNSFATDVRCVHVTNYNQMANVANYDQILHHYRSRHRHRHHLFFIFHQNVIILISARICIL